MGLDVALWASRQISEDESNSLFDSCRYPGAGWILAGADDDGIKQAVIRAGLKSYCFADYCTVRVVRSSKIVSPFGPRIFLECAYWRNAYEVGAWIDGNGVEFVDEDTTRPLTVDELTRMAASLGAGGLDVSRIYEITEMMKADPGVLITYESD